MDVLAESAAKTPVPAEGYAGAEAGSRATMKKPVKNEKEEDDEDEEDDPEVQKVLARRARGAGKKPVGRRR